MRLQLDQFGKLKNHIHAVQAVFLFLAWVLTIAVLTREGRSDGRVGWYFGLCFLTIPILVYLVMVPMWSRARKFANVYAFATLDSLSIVLWLSAWAAVASYVNQGKGNGDNTDESGCDNFEFGSPSRCRLSEAIIAFGVIEMLLFGATAFISFRAVMTYKRTGMMPNTRQTEGYPNDFSAQSQAAFSSNMHDDVEDGTDNDYRPDYGQKPSVEDEYAPIVQNDHNDIAHMPAQQPQSPLNSSGLGIQSYNAAYDSSYGRQEDGFLTMPEPKR
ncbi:hypothetical protein B0A52_06901 [Exophiala mesophila]|uniref:MARVEL domain-containing protein n=1 Tax=Exophiala mesophila TaxID=212818 RepID=A0A438N0S9_EXOME|nr:hypothetical protein B0A52_06901 [Exophiala mesophila]